MFEILQDPHGRELAGWVAGFGLAAGLIVGSFLNVVAHRLPLGLSVVSPGSRCPACESAIRPWDNVPVLSFLWLRGHCRRCGAGISWRYPAVELFTGIVFAMIALRFGLTLETLLFWVFAAGLIAASLVDFDHQIIPDEISLGGLVFGCIATPSVSWLAGMALIDALLFSLGGALLGGGLLWSVGFFHARLSVAMGRSFEHWPGDGESLPGPASLDYWIWFPGLGFGDVKLLAMIGAFLGPFGVLETIFSASLLGLATGLVWVAVTRRFSSPFGFGPALAGGALVSLMLPHALIGI